MPKILNSEKGITHILLLLAAIGLLIFLLITNTFQFKDKLFSKLFPKHYSYGLETELTVDQVGQLTKELLDARDGAAGSSFLLITNAYAAVDVAGMVDIASKRKDLLDNEIVRDTDAFLQHAVLADQRGTFPTDVQPYIEQKVTTSGTFGVFYEENIDSGVFDYTYTINPNTITTQTPISTPVPTVVPTPVATSTPITTPSPTPVPIVTPVPDTQAPTAPTNLTASVISSSQINLSWNPSTDNVGVTGYDIYRNSAKIATVTSTSYGDANLLASSSYSYQIKAFDAAGNNSPFSNTVSANTQTTQVIIGNIKGTVTSSQGGVLSKVNVSTTVGTSKKSVTTNSSGVYSFTNLPLGNYTLTFQKRGFTTQIVSLTITGDQVVTKDITLVKK